MNANQRRKFRRLKERFFAAAEAAVPGCLDSKNRNDQEMENRFAQWTGSEEVQNLLKHYPQLSRKMWVVSRMHYAAMAQVRQINEL